MLVPDTTNNTYLLEVDGSQCYTVGGSNISANSWTWVAHQNGNINSKIDLSLSKGNHNLKLIGNKPGVAVDRIVFSSDTACTPTGTAGTNCNTTADTTAPTVKLTNPGSGKTVSGLTSVEATASDDVGVTKVDFYVDSSLKASDTSAPYSFQWDTGLIGNGSHTLIAKAYDAAGNVSSDSYSVSVANGDKQPPTAPGGLTGKATAYNTVELSWQASTDDKDIRSYTVYRNDVPLTTVTATTFQDTGLFASTTYQYKVLATDNSSNNSPFSNAVSVATPSVADSQAPSVPAGITTKTISDTQINLFWQPSTDNIGVKAYDIYRAVKGKTAVKIAEVAGTSFGDGSVDPGKTYTYTIRARDANGNVSEASRPITATTKNATKKPITIFGTVQDSHTRQPIKGARVLVLSGNTTYSYTVNSDGHYVFSNLASGRYNISFRAHGYDSKSFAVHVSEGHKEHNVKLEKDKNR